MFFNVLYGEFGETGLKQALKNGIIPAEFTQELSQQLEVSPGDAANMNEINGFLTGGPGWTHASSADFLRSHQGSSIEAEEM